MQSKNHKDSLGAHTRPINTDILPRGLPVLKKLAQANHAVKSRLWVTLYK